MRLRDLRSGPLLRLATVVIVACADLMLAACAAGSTRQRESRLRFTPDPPAAAQAFAPEPEVDADPPALEIASLPMTTDRFPPPLPADLDAGAMTRAALLEGLRAGIPHFLNLVQIEAERKHGSFWGWRIVAMDRRLARATVLRPGDVVHSVNRAPVERPEHLTQLWSALKGAQELHVDVTRGDQRCQIRYQITEGSLAVAR